MQPYRGIDLLDIESQLTDDERQVRNTVRDFVEAEAVPAVVPHFREGTFPVKLVPRMGDLGILGAHLEGYGCAGLGPVAYGLIMQELERARLRLPLIRFGPVVAGDDCYPPVSAPRNIVNGSCLTWPLAVSSARSA